LNVNTNKSKSAFGDNSKSASYNASASRSKIHFTSKSNMKSDYLTPEQQEDEEMLGSFNKEGSHYDKSGFEEQHMMMGEDINYSPDSSIRIPRTSFTDDGTINDRQKRFQKDRYSSIHAKQEKGNKKTKNVPTTELEQVHEEQRESESKTNFEHEEDFGYIDEFKESFSREEDEDTEIIVAEVDSSDLEKYGNSRHLNS
jgi:hypothetical protein